MGGNRILNVISECQSIHVLLSHVLKGTKGGFTDVKTLAKVLKQLRDKAKKK